MADYVKGHVMNSGNYAAALKPAEQSYAMRLVLIASIAAGVFFLLCVAGIVTRYSPVPIGDDWKGYVGFNLDVLEGKMSAWWALDDAHRLIVARLPIWLDFHFFDARFIFLIVVNVIVRIGILATLIVYARDKISDPILFVLSALFCVLAFAWMQAPSFYHAWVGLAEFPVILFPMLAFYWLHRAKRSVGWFFLAILAGVISVGTLANGLLVLPIMTVMSALIGLRRGQIASLASLSVLSFVLYFWNFQYPNDSRPDLATFALFVLTYLGSPFYYIVYYWLAGLQHAFDLVSGHGHVLVSGNYLDYPGSRTAGIVTAVVAGLGLVAAVTRIAWRWLHSDRSDTCEIALLSLIGFIFATAALAAIGRAASGFDYAVQERYTTGPLLAWQALLILLMSRIETRTALRVLAALIVSIPIALMPNQLKAVLKPDVQDQVGHELSLKALQSGQSNDEEVDRQVKRLKKMGIVLGQ